MALERDHKASLKRPVERFLLPRNCRELRHRKLMEFGRRWGGGTPGGRGKSGRRREDGKVTVASAARPLGIRAADAHRKCLPNGLSRRRRAADRGPGERLPRF